MAKNRGRRRSGEGSGGAGGLPTMGEDSTGAIFQGNNAGNNASPLPEGYPKEALDAQLRNTMLTDVRRNSLTGDVGYMSGNPKADLHNLWEHSGLAEEMEFNQFQEYYENNVEPEVLQLRNDMMNYLREHPERDTVTAYGWLNGAYN